MEAEGSLRKFTVRNSQKCMGCFEHSGALNWSFGETLTLWGEGTPLVYTDRVAGTLLNV